MNWLAQPYLKMLDISVIYFGLIFTSFSIIAAIGSALIDQFEKVAGQKSFLLMNQTLVSDKVLTLIPAERAATILSFANLLRRLIYAAFGPVVGLISDFYGIMATLQVNAAVFLFVLAFCY